MPPNIARTECHSTQGGGEGGSPVASCAPSKLPAALIKGVPSRPLRYLGVEARGLAPIVCTTEIFRRFVAA